MNLRQRAREAQLKLATTFGAKGAGGAKVPGSRASIRSGGPVPSGRPKSLRPGADTLDPDIPLFLIGKNKDGFWVAREENNCAGGVFFTERGARQFAKRWAMPCGCATVCASEPLELDFEGEGNVLIPLLAVLKSRGFCGMPEPALDAMVIVLGLSAVALATWLVVTMLTLGA